MAMLDEVLAGPESDASVWGLGTRVDLVACGDEDGTSPCGWPRGFILLLNFEIILMMFASSVLMAVWAGSGDLTMSTFAYSARQSCGLNVLCWYASLGRPMAATPATRAD